MSARPSVPKPGGTLPSRHIHLDFHTSPTVPDVGREFDPIAFVDTLVDAAVASITVFAKCHHGMAYYPTKHGTQHPGLDRDLLGEIVGACHGAGIRVAAYLSTMYDQHVWRNHPEWRSVAPDGWFRGLRGAARPLGTELGLLCLNTGYLDDLLVMTAEVLDSYEVDGIFFDNFYYGTVSGDNDGCCCVSCMADREALGLDSADPQERIRHMHLTMGRVCERLFTAVTSRQEEASVFVNGPLLTSQDPAFIRAIASLYRHAEIESLPGGGWGYDHFPVAVRLFRTFNLDMLGMTGSFHKGWGDFGTVRSQAALDYECQSMLAHGAKVSVGDHMHPRGRLNPVTYERIGKTFRTIKESEPWCDNARPIAEVGVLFTGARADVGATKVLTQLHYTFDFIDEAADLRRYRVIVLPDVCHISAELAERLTAYLRGGGRILASGDSGLGPDGGESALPLGVVSRAPWPHSDQYIDVTGAGEAVTPDMVHVSYEHGAVIEVAPEARVLARYWRSYFDSSYQHFQVEQAPPAEATNDAAAVATESSVYIGPPIFRMYADYAYPVYRDFVGSCVRELMPDPVLRIDGPATVQATLTEQPGRHVVHLLTYLPERRAPGLDVVEDVLGVGKLRCSVRVMDRPERVYIAPDMIDLEFSYDGRYAHAELQQVFGRSILVFEMAGASGA